MTDYTWPVDLVPYAVSFYLQPHTGGSESPFNRVTKVYGLGASRWVCSLSFRGGYEGTRDQGAFGPRLDALLADLEGRLNRIAIYDFRRPKMRSRAWPGNASNLLAAVDATSMTITNLPPGTPIYTGDYIGGDGRPHIIKAADFGPIATVADSSGQAVVSFKPPLKAEVAAGAVIFGNPTGLFRMTEDDVANGVAVGEGVSMTLNFVEDL